MWLRELFFYNLGEPDESDSAICVLEGVVAYLFLFTISPEVSPIVLSFDNFDVTLLLL